MKEIRKTVEDGWKAGGRSGPAKNPKKKKAKEEQEDDDLLDDLVLEKDPDR